MTDKSELEKMLNAVINGDNAVADQAFHDYLSNKVKTIIQKEKDEAEVTDSDNNE